MQKLRQVFQMKKYQSRQYCADCHDEFYLMRDGKCWSMNDAKIVWRKFCGLHDKPPYNYIKKRRYASCWHSQGKFEVD